MAIRHDECGVAGCVPCRLRGLGFSDEQRDMTAALMIHAGGVGAGLAAARLLGDWPTARDWVSANRHHLQLPYEAIRAALDAVVASMYPPSPDVAEKMRRNE